MSIIPKPSSIQVQSDNGFAITNRVGVMASGFTGETPLTSYVVQQIQTQTGIRIGETAGPSTGLIELTLNGTKINLGYEGYTLKSNETGVQIEAATENGLFYGIQSLLQLLPPKPGGERPVVPAVQIFDRPRFAYRGMHLDVGRHFMPVSFIKKYIDLIALHKMNTFHWHLTEDQGWRIEIKKYPKLTEVASWRDETVIGHAAGSEVYDGKRYGGFYTQEQIKEVVAYAQSRYVTIIPEIEMPGHSQAAIAAYPELGCTGKQIKPMTTWGVSKDVFCPSDVTFSFLEDVLTEVISLFPSKYIHIGGDEVPKDHWKAHAGAQALMQKEGLKD
ncbi:MAG TPA: beta-N-acetylhexosaminidase, partial [Rhodothermales bacterium]|nr:beta-N-acetylhexosaminidase [Rhodothermales bacterium]